MQFIVLYVGSLSQDKNLSVMIQAFSLLYRKYSDSRLWVIGEGALKDDLANLVNILGIQDGVKMFGQIENSVLDKYYAEASIFVYPSLGEISGRSIVEAMYYSKPVIISKSSLISVDLVEDGINGFLISGNSEVEFAEKLFLLREDSSLREKMGIASLRIAEKFKLDNVIDHMEHLYKDLLKF